MSKKKALIIVTISVEPHNPAQLLTFEVAHMGKDTLEVLTTMIEDRCKDLLKERRASTKGGASAS